MEDFLVNSNVNIKGNIIRENGNLFLVLTDINIRILIDDNLAEKLLAIFNKDVDIIYNEIEILKNKILPKKTLAISFLEDFIIDYTNKNTCNPEPEPESINSKSNNSCNHGDFNSCNNNCNNNCNNKCNNTEMPNKYRKNFNNNDSMKHNFLDSLTHDTDNLICIRMIKNIC